MFAYSPWANSDSFNLARARWKNSASLTGTFMSVIVEDVMKK
jgi:hypothetical protein